MSFKKIISSIIFLSLLAFLVSSFFNRQQTVDVAIMQIVPHPSLDKIREGFIETIKKEQPSLNIIYQNAQGNMTLSMQMAQKFSSLNPKIIVAIETPSALNAYNAARNKNIPVVFGAVTDPVGAGLAKSFAEPLSGVTGVSDVLNNTDQILFIHHLLEGSIPVKKIGTLYNPSEQNSVSQIQRFEEALNGTAYSLVKMPVHATADISVVVKRLVEDVDVVVIFNDNTVVSGMAQLIKIADEEKKPVIATDPESVQLGALAALAYDQHEMGVQAAHLALRAITYKKDKKEIIIPIETAQSVAVYINKEKKRLFNIKDFESDKRFQKIHYVESKK